MGQPTPDTIVWFGIWARNSTSESWRSSATGRVGQDLQDGWASLSVTTLVECVNHKDESMFWMARKGADEIKEARVPYRPCCQIPSITTQAPPHLSNTREDS